MRARLLIAATLGALLAIPAQAVRIGAFDTPPPAPAPAAPSLPATPETRSAPEPVAAAVPADRETELLALLGQPPVDLDLVRELADLRRDRAIAAWDADQPAQAFDLLTNALSLDPLRAADWETLGDWAATLGDIDGDAIAEHAYRQVVDLDPEHARARIKIAAISVAYGQYPAALEQIELALQSPRVDSPEWNQLVLLTQLYVRAQRAGQGLAFLQGQYERSADDRYLLAEAVLLDALGEGEAAAQLAAVVADRGLTPVALKDYAKRLATRFAEAGDQRQRGVVDARQPWSAQP